MHHRIWLLLHRFQALWLQAMTVNWASAEGQDDCVLYGVSAMQGWRITMEDAHAAILDLQAKYINKSLEPTPADQRLSFFGVYDGHGGDKVALFAGEKLHQIVAKQEAFSKGNIEQALKDGFLATDRAILDGEKARISAAGGFVDFGRVNGNLALSRAIGDFEFKKSAELSPEQQIVTAYPDVTTHEITEDDEFLVIACDGIWDCQSSQAVVEFVRRGIAAKQELYRICENMMDNCLSSNSETGGVGCDNMTMTIVGLLHGKTKDEWYNTIAERVAKGDGPVAPPEVIAEFRGPGVRPGARHQFDDSPDDYDLESDNNRRAFGVRSGRIILLGDGTEVHADQDDEELFDATEEADKGVQNQVRASTANAGHDTGRNLREDTPGPELTHRNAIQSTETAHTGPQVSASPSTINADTSPGKTSENKAASKPSDS
uniref:protein-serine/threonine phosphatase n=1 Tax=Talaromyces marneffei PM1 TaxID=1077442 RepID=A0A093Y0A2_TALMA